MASVEQQNDPHYQHARATYKAIEHVLEQIAVAPDNETKCDAIRAILETLNAFRNDTYSKAAVFPFYKLTETFNANAQNKPVLSQLNWLFNFNLEKRASELLPLLYTASGNEHQEAREFSYDLGETLLRYNVPPADVVKGMILPADADQYYKAHSFVEKVIDVEKAIYSDAETHGTNAIPWIKGALAAAAAIPVEEPDWSSLLIEKYTKLAQKIDLTTPLTDPELRILVDQANAADKIANEEADKKKAEIAQQNAALLAAVKALKAIPSSDYDYKRPANLVVS